MFNETGRKFITANWIYQIKLFKCLDNVIIQDKS